MAKVAINGLGRIGRALLKIITDTPELELVAFNDLGTAENLRYLLAYDTVYGRWERELKAEDGTLIVESRRIRALRERDPSKLPWKDLGVDLVFECTGVLTSREDLEKHIEAGARFAILSAPSKSQDVPTIVHGVSRPDGEQPQIYSCASCTTNCITPVVEVMGRRIGFSKAIMTTVHAYTATQELIDKSNKHPRRGRAAALNIIPSSTGAAVATTRALPEYEKLFDGAALRVPVAVGSIADIVFVTSRKTSVQEVNSIFTEEAESKRYASVLGITWEPIVSSDIIRDPRASIVDLSLTMVVDGDLVKVMSFYDNEWGYANQMVREARRALGKG